MLDTPSPPARTSIPWPVYALAGATSLLIAAVYFAVYALGSGDIELGPLPLEGTAFTGLGVVLIAVGYFRRSQGRA